VRDEGRGRGVARADLGADDHVLARDAAQCRAERAFTGAGVVDLGGVEKIYSRDRLRPARWRLPRSDSGGPSSRRRQTPSSPTPRTGSTRNWEAPAAAKRGWRWSVGLAGRSRWPPATAVDCPPGRAQRRAPPQRLALRGDAEPGRAWRSPDRPRELRGERGGGELAVAPREIDVHRTAGASGPSCEPGGPRFRECGEQLRFPGRGIAGAFRQCRR